MKFSIITPTYNRGQTIERAINSILKQTHQEFELIIIDDGSTDNTRQIVDKYLSDTRIKYIPLNANAGVNVARNTGFENISADTHWITFLDSDDEFLTDALENMSQAITLNASLNYFRFAVKYDHGKYACDVRLSGSILDYEQAIESKMAEGEWVAVLRKSIIDRGFRFEKSINGFEKISWLNLAKTEKVLYDSTLVRIYFTDVESIIRTNKKDKKWYLNNKYGLTLYIERFGKDLKKHNQKQYAKDLYALGNVEFIVGHYMSGFQHTFDAFKAEPFNPRIIRNFLTLFFSKKL